MCKIYRFSGQIPSNAAIRDGSSRLTALDSVKSVVLVFICCRNALEGKNSAHTAARNSIFKKANSVGQGG